MYNIAETTVWMLRFSVIWTVMCTVYQGFLSRFKGTKVLCKQFNFKRTTRFNGRLFLKHSWNLVLQLVFLVFTFISKVIFAKLIKRLHQFTFKSEIRCFDENIVLYITVRKPTCFPWFERKSYWHNFAIFSI